MTLEGEMEMKKIFSWSLILIGAGTLLFYSFQFVELKRYEEQALDEARSMFDQFAYAEADTESSKVEQGSTEKDKTVEKSRAKHTYGEGYGPTEVQKKWSDMMDQRNGNVPSLNAFNDGEIVGMFYVPRLNRELPIVEGTDEDELAKGVGHFKGTGHPGGGKQILLSGHRDTVFRDFGELQIGDELRVVMEHGVFTYVIDSMEVVSAQDTSVIDLDSNEEMLVVSTCYPFHFIGSAPERYIVYAYPKVN